MRRTFRVAIALLALASVSGVSYAKKVRNDDRPVVTYSGLSVHEDKGVTLRVELSRSVSFASSKRGKVTSFLLDGATVRQRTNLYPLRAEHFGVEVVSTKLDKAKGGVKFSVVLRHDVALKTQLIEHGQGATLLVEVPPPPPELEKKNEQPSEPAKSADAPAAAQAPATAKQ